MPDHQNAGAAASSGIHHLWDYLAALGGGLVLHFNVSAWVQALTLLVLATRLALNVREWFKGRK
jgi:membrane protein implicated in regulation of membrane protease activity